MCNQNANIADEGKETRYKLSGKMDALQLSSVAEASKTNELISARASNIDEAVSSGLKQDHDERINEKSNEEKKRQVDKLIQSLWFPDMNARYNMQSLDHHAGTFNWVFDSLYGEDPDDDTDEDDTAEDDPDEGDTDERNTDRALEEDTQQDLDENSDASQIEDQDEDPDESDLGDQAEQTMFVTWLRSDEKLFWTSGKPGSGKSTLMKFLIEDQRTISHLSQKEKEVLVIKAFLFSAGSSHMQMSLRGLLCTLLFQMLVENRDVARHLLDDDKKMRLKTEPSNWSVRELDGALNRGIAGSHRFVGIFIDGLDEVDPKYGSKAVLDLIFSLHELLSIKICVSSRLEVALRERLKSFPHFRMQDINNRDIRKYVIDNLGADGSENEASED